MKLFMMLDTVEFLLDYVTNVSDPLLDALHRAEREMIDKNRNMILVSFDPFEEERLRAVVEQLLEDDKTIPTELARVAITNKN
tara:strand:- start:894 stop:1142 length:249 start_codon:yes stop_codon:yes gene_type:complete